MTQSSINVLLELAGDAIFAVALAGAASHEPYGVGNEFRRGAEDGRTRLGARRVGTEARCAEQIRVGARVEAVSFDAFLVDPERVVFREF